MPSFDIVSEVDPEEVRNAVENASRELDTRYDFKGVEASFKWTKDETTATAESDFQIGQMLDILRESGGRAVAAAETTRPARTCCQT